MCHPSILSAILYKTVHAIVSQLLASLAQFRFCATVFGLNCCINRQLFCDDCLMDVLGRLHDHDKILGLKNVS